MSHGSVGWKEPLSPMTSFLKEDYRQCRIRSALVLSSWVMENLQGQFHCLFGCSGGKKSVAWHCLFSVCGKGYRGEQGGNTLCVSLGRFQLPNKNLIKYGRKQRCAKAAVLCNQEVLIS